MASVDGRFCGKYADTLRELDENGVAVIPDQFSSIIHKYNIAHCPAAWSARLAAKPVFAGLWGTEKLLTSTDGIALAQPPELQGSGEFWKEGDYTGLHHDQGKSRVGLHSYQGALHLEDAEEDDYCFMAIEKSHQFHSEFFNMIPEHKRSESRKLNKGNIDWFKKKGCKIRRVSCAKGGMIASPLVLPSAQGAAQEPATQETAAKEPAQDPTQEPSTGEKKKYLSSEQKSAIQRAFEDGLTGWRLPQDKVAVANLAVSLRLTEKQVKVEYPLSVSYLVTT
ncbi:hypothetical protein CAPTEDRAFT_211503 [Capitella teleta]|uniref:Uncharacterized protein n=1 Tax=Capitella teleta TaxID=283909 RepID=R7UAT8_CAPTE|nr:hypothetical protein CAPTEDRAFT_211503 [Capitella teleta]|eukprot:ELU03445.1 hypothetical protein CAPTEDRAFT_211503 [Capitella teleta]